MEDEEAERSDIDLTKELRAEREGLEGNFP